MWHHEKKSELCYFSPSSSLGAHKRNRIQKNKKKDVIATSSTQVNAPSFFHLSVLKDVNWEETPSFVEGKMPLKGIEGKIAMADSPIIANEQNEIMWHFLDPESTNWKIVYYCAKTRICNSNTSTLSTRNFQTNLDYFKYNRFYYKRTPPHYVTTFIWIMVIKYIYK